MPSRNHSMTGRRQVIILLITIIGIATAVDGSGAGLPWPLSPDQPSHVVSYFYGGWQAMWRQEWSRNANYFHTGIDIPGDTAQTAYAMESGYVKAIYTIFNSAYHWRIVIADSSGTDTCEAWLYAHIVPESMPFSVGDHVNAGDSLGVLVTWPYVGTPVHLHVSRVRFGGTDDQWAAGFWDYVCIANPLNYLGVIGDTIPPYMEDAWPGRRFAICTNETGVFFGAGADISGDVDIICSAYDYGGSRNYGRTSPYRLEYRIEGDSSLPWTTAFEFGGSLDSYDGEMEAFSHVVYKYNAACSTTFSDSLRAFFILTNTDGDGIIEIDDKNHCWSTPSFHNGEYIIWVRLSDFDGNSFIDSETVTVSNHFTLTGTVVLDGIDPNRGGTTITILPDDQSTVTLSTGAYSLPAVGGGYQTVRVSHPGYVSLDTLLLFDQNRQLDAMLSLIDYVCGDANCDGQANVGDAVRLINFVFKGGPAPVPLEAGDANCDAMVNVADAVYLINFVFKGGPAPKCPTSAPNVTTADVGEIMQTTAQCGGTVVSGGGAAVTARGVCWSTNQTPTVADAKTTDGTGLGGFVSALTGLAATTTYYVAAYATNGVGTGYGGIKSFTTTDSMGTVTDIDGNTYRTVKIGNQWWMAENLEVTNYRNGDPIPNVSDSAAWAGQTAGAYCNYNNDVANVAAYGRLYNWYVMTDSRSMAPEGWHLPSDAEWQTLINYLGGNAAAGWKMKEAGTAHWLPPNTGTNECGFTALPGGYRGTLYGIFGDLGNYACFWSTTAVSSTYGWYRSISYDNPTVDHYDSRKHYGFSVRCVKD